MKPVSRARLQTCWVVCFVNPRNSKWKYDLVGVLSRQRGLGRVRPEDPNNQPPTTTKKARSLCEKSHRLLAIFLRQCLNNLPCGGVNKLNAKFQPQGLCDFSHVCLCEIVPLHFVVEVLGGKPHSPGEFCLWQIASLHTCDSDAFNHTHDYHLMDSIHHSIYSVK